MVSGGDALIGTIYLIITYGIIGGAGIGFAYVCPIAALVKWFPDKKGAITGIAVAGFGAGALVFGYVEQFLQCTNYCKYWIAYVDTWCGLSCFCGNRCSSTN